MRRPLLAALAILGAMLLPGIAAAQNVAYSAAGATNMRAGPGQNFPVIAQVVGGSRVNVIGCIQDYSWCDTTVQGFRGWISTTRLEFPYAGRRVAVPQYRADFGAPVIGFDFGYWDRNYSDRSFYRDRGNWDRDWRGRGRHRDGERYGRRGRDRGDDYYREGRRGRDRDRDDQDYDRRADDGGERDGRDSADGEGRRRGGGDGESRRGGSEEFERADEGRGRDGRGQDGRGQDGRDCAPGFQGCP